jgi:acyl-CoA thioesterase
VAIKAGKEFPFANHIGLHFEARGEGTSECSLTIQEHHRNSLGGVHGGVMFSLADTGMGAALYTRLEPDEICVTIEVKINYFKAVRDGTLVCKSTVVYKGRSVANIEASLYESDVLVAKANSSFSIFKRVRDQAI